MRKVVKAKVFIRKDTSSNWEYNNPILASGQIGFDTTVGKHKIGNGEKRWRELPYFILETDLEDRVTFIIRTKEEWSTWGREISQVGVFYIYSNNEQLDGVDIPGIKIGDGMAYISDLPFITDKISAQLYDHINDQIRHITQEERDFWNNKVTSYINGSDNENLVFDKGTLLLN